MNIKKIISAAGIATSVVAAGVYAGGLDLFPYVFDNKDVTVVYGEDSARSDKEAAHNFVADLYDIANHNLYTRVEYVDRELFLRDDYESEDIKDSTVFREDADDYIDTLKEQGYEILNRVAVSRSDVDFDTLRVRSDDDVFNPQNTLVIGGPAVNAVAAELLGVPYPTYEYGVKEGEFVIRYFKDENSVLIYGYDADDTVAALDYLSENGVSGNFVKVSN